MIDTASFALHPIGHIQSALRALADAPRQGAEGAPDAWLHFDARYAAALHGISQGQSLIIITWLHLADRSVLETHPRNDLTLPLTGVFATRSPDRPNPLGLHRVTVRQVRDASLLVGPLEAIDGTPIIDVKATLGAPSTDD